MVAELINTNQQLHIQNIYETMYDIWLEPDNKQLVRWNITMLMHVSDRCIFENSTISELRELSRVIIPEDFKLHLEQD